MSTSRAALLVGLLCAASPAVAEDAAKWAPKHETWADWPTVRFSDGTKNRLLYYRRADAAKCNPKNTKPGACLIDLYELTQTGEPVGIKSARTPVDAGGKKGKTETIDSKLTSYSTALSHYKLDVKQDLQVVQGDKHFNAVRNTASLSTEGSQIFVLPPKSETTLSDAAPTTTAKVKKPKKLKPAASTGTASTGNVSTAPVPKETATTEPVSTKSPPKPTRHPANEAGDALQQKTLQDKRNASAGYRKPPFEPEAKDQSAQFAPFMTEKELADYKASIKGMSEPRMLEINIEQLRKIAGRTPYPLEQYVTEDNFERLEPWEQERFCTNFFNGKHKENATETSETWKPKACSKYAGKPKIEGASDRLTAEEMALLTPQELATYKAILESQKGSTADGNLEHSTEFYREKIKKEGRTKKYPDPNNAQEFAKLEAWQQKDFCGRLRAQGSPAPSAPVTGSKEALPALKALNSCVEGDGRSCGKSVVDGHNAAGAVVAAPAGSDAPTTDWRKKACEDALTALPPAGGDGKKPGDDKSTHDEHAKKKTIDGSVKGPDLKPDQTPSGRSKWLAPEHLYNGAKGSLVGILLGSLGGPMGMVGGALAGAAFFYALSKITSNKN